MAVLQIIYGLDQIFFKKANLVTEFDENLKKLSKDMQDTMLFENALGIGANMVGVLQRIIVVKNEHDSNNSILMINPEIIEFSDQTNIFEEGSLSFPGIKAKISRPKTITLKYQDITGSMHNLDADNLFSRVIQHEIDYLNGKTIFDHVSKLKKDSMIKKMNKHMEKYKPHVHTSSCRH
jgi:peptide deformylase